MKKIEFTVREVAEFMGHCQDFYPDAHFDRTRFVVMLMQAAALVTAESMMYPERYNAEVTMADLKKETLKMEGVVEQYLKILKKGKV